MKSEDATLPSTPAPCDNPLSNRMAVPGATSETMNWGFGQWTQWRGGWPWRGAVREIPVHGADARP